jgi:hypothetical protein
MNPETMGFSTVKNFHKYLHSIGIDIAEKELKNLLKEHIPSLSISKDQRMVYPRRTILPHFLSELYFCDLMFFQKNILSSNRIGGAFASLSLLDDKKQALLFSNSRTRRSSVSLLLSTTNKKKNGSSYGGTAGQDFSTTKLYHIDNGQRHRVW